MKNTIARSYSGVVAQTNQVLAGVEAHAATIPLTMVTGNALTTELTAFIAGETATNQAKAELATRSNSLKEQTKTARIYIWLAREVLRQYLGHRHSAAWEQAGFVGSFRLPESEDKYLEVLLALSAYFTANQPHENAALNVTASRCTTLYNDLKNARNSLNAQRTTRAQAIATRDAKGLAVQNLIRSALKELSVKLNRLDERWTAFGFNKPGSEHVADVPENVTAVLVGPNAALVRWDAAPRAAHYRVWMKVVGVDEDFISVGNPADVDFTIQGLPSNATIQIAVSAVNTGGESGKSAVVTIATT